MGGISSKLSKDTTYRRWHWSCGFLQWISL